jgi:hypothetical protein
MMQWFIHFVVFPIKLWVRPWLIKLFHWVITRFISNRLIMYCMEVAHRNRALTQIYKCLPSALRSLLLWNRSIIVLIHSVLTWDRRRPIFRVLIVGFIIKMIVIVLGVEAVRNHFIWRRNSVVRMTHEIRLAVTTTVKLKRFLILWSSIIHNEVLVFFTHSIFALVLFS